MSHRVSATFDKGLIPTIGVANLATVPLGVDFKELCATLQKLVNLFVPIWGTPATIVSLPGKTIPASYWGIVLLNDADQAGALGYHDVTAAGLPLSKIFVKTTLAAGDIVSETSRVFASQTVRNSIISNKSIGHFKSCHRATCRCFIKASGPSSMAKRQPRSSRYANIPARHGGAMIH